MRAHLCGCALALLVAAPEAARAHHTALRPRRDSAAAGDRPSAAAVAASATAFDIGDQEGRFYTVAAELQLRLGRRWRLGLRLPVHHVDQGGDSSSGGGDLGVGGRVHARLGAWDGWGGLDLLLPTGDPERGLGHGDTSVAASLQAVRSFARGWRAGGMVVALVDVTDRADDARVIVEHRADAELRAGALASFTGSRVRVSGELRLIAPLAPESARGELYPTLAPSAAARLGGGVWVELSAELPLAPARQLDWQTGLSLAWEWGEAATGSS